MARLKLTLACWDYDRTRALADGSVRPEGIDLVYLPLPVEETFYRMLRGREFHCAEMSLSSYVMTLGAARPPFIAIPAFPSRYFRHGCIFVSAKSGIARPGDLAGKRVGVPEYQMTAAVWIRGILADEYELPVDSAEYFSGGLEQPGRAEKIALELPARIKVTPIGKKQTLARMLAEGKIDALYSARAPSTLRTRPAEVRRLFPDYVAAERDYFRRTKIFPIMHTVVIRRDLHDRHPWVAQSLYKAFLASLKKASEGLEQSAALMAMLPWLAQHVEETKRELGPDWWPYGLAPNRHALKTFLRYHQEQGLSKRRFAPEELFAKATLAEFRI
jgi:4,5-dihydroxyphthalate decarboxylase